MLLLVGTAMGIGCLAQCPCVQHHLDVLCVWGVWGVFCCACRSVGGVTLAAPALGNQVLCTTGSPCTDDVSSNTTVTLALVEVTSGQVIAQEVFSPACGNASISWLQPVPRPGLAADGGDLLALDAQAALQHWLRTNPASGDQAAFQPQVSCTAIVVDDCGRETRQLSPPRSAMDLRPCEFTLSALTIDDYAAEPAFQVGNKTFRYAARIVGIRHDSSAWLCIQVPCCRPFTAVCHLGLATAPDPRVTSSSRRVLLRCWQGSRHV